MTEKQIIGLIMLIGIPLVCCCLIALCINYWVKKIKSNKKQTPKFSKNTLTENELLNNKPETKISKSEAHFQQWKAERERKGL